MKKTLIIAFISIFALRAACDFSAPRENSNDPKVMSDSEAVATDKESIQIEYADGDSEENVTQNVTLPTTGVSGTTISWSSDRTNISAATTTLGKVTRPDYASGDYTVNLTATITRGNTSDTKIFTLIVIGKSAVCAATASGLSVSQDEGATWSTNATLNGLQINAVYCSGQTIYAATETAGVYKSTNGGGIYSSYNTGLGNNTVNDIYYYNNIIYAATDGGLSIRSTKATTWTNFVSSKYGIASNTVYAVKAIQITSILPPYTKTSYIVIATDAGISITSDGGSTWTTRNNSNSGLAHDNVNDIYLTSYLFGSLKIYAATNGGVSVSTNGGASWTNYTTSNNLLSNTVNGIFSVASVIYVATNSGGISYLPNGASNFLSYSNTGNTFTIAYDIFKYGDNIFAATNNGLIISTTNGGSWTTFDTGDGLAHNTVYGVSAK